MGSGSQTAARASALLHQTLLGDAWQRAEIAVVIFDDDGNYLAANEHYLAITGRSREQVMQLRAGQNLLMSEEERARFAEIIRGGISHGRATIARA